MMEEQFDADTICISVIFLCIELIKKGRYIYTSKATTDFCKTVVLIQTDPADRVNPSTVDHIISKHSAHPNYRNYKGHYR